MQFKAGDTVRLKSGGPDMTVETVEGAYVFCAWFDKAHKPHARKFPMSALEGEDEVGKILESVKQENRKK